MPGLKHYIDLVENIQPGDELDIELAPDSLLESYVLEASKDSVTIYGDDAVTALLESFGCEIVEDIARYGAVGNSRAMGFTNEDSDVDPNTHPQTKDYGAGRDEREEELDEGVMSEIDIDLQNIASSEDFDMLYDAFNGKMGQATQSYLENMFAKVAQHNRLHPDDQQEDILEIMMDQIVDDYGDGDIDTPAEPAEPVAEDFMSRMLELAGCTRMEEEANTTDPLAAKAAALAPVGADGDTDKVTTIDEDPTQQETGYQETGVDNDTTSEEDPIGEAEYRGRKVPLGKPMRGDVKKFKVYVKDPKTGNVKKVNFGHGGTSAKRAGQKTMKIKKSDPARRRSFRARHRCDNPGPRTKARYWSCRAW